MILAFVGHSFEPKDKSTINDFIDYFDSLKKNVPFFDYDRAKEPDINFISAKAIEKMSCKNVFIGILTKKHYEFSGEKAVPGRLWNKNKWLINNADVHWGASDWIIQESGYALGKGMKVLFLIENGVRPPDGLHADSERIPFDSSNVSACFADILKALGNFNDRLEPRPQNEGQKSSLETIDKKDTKTEIRESSGLKKEELDDDEINFDYIFNAVSSKDVDQINQMKENIAKKYSHDNEKLVRQKAIILTTESDLLNKNVLNELKALKSHNPRHADLLLNLGFELEKYKEHEAAAKEYELSAQLTEDVESKIRRTEFAANSYILVKGQENKALELLLLLATATLPEKLAFLVYRALANTARNTGKKDLFFAFSEKALSVDPSNSTLRFDLAWDYDKHDRHDMALYHRKILNQFDANAANNNNLGVTYAKMEMIAKAIPFYKAAAEQENSISMGNLAQKFLDAGFIEEAEMFINRASALKDYDKSVIGKVLARLQKIREGENEKEKSSLDAVAPERMFMIDYGEAYVIPFVGQKEMNGKWSTPHGDIAISFENGMLNGSEKREVDSPSLMSLALGKGLGASPETSKRKETVEISGTIHNRAIDYTIKVIKEYLPGESLLSKPADEEYEGKAVLDSTGKKMQTFENLRGKKPALNTMQKKET